jgi:excisionase family DNA binding protein
MQTQIITFPRLAYSLAELEVLTGLSRSTFYRMVARGELETVKFGRSRMVSTREAAKLFRNEQTDGN